MDKVTKHCALKVYLKNGHHMAGQFHVPSRTSSTIRPSDAILERHNGLLLLSDVTIVENEVSRHVDAVMVPCDAISYIELPTGWNSRHGSVTEDEQSGTAPAPSTRPQTAAPTSGPGTSRWLVGRHRPQT